MKTKLFTLLLAVAASVGTNAKLIDLTAIGTTIDEWTVSEASLNNTESDPSTGKYVYDIKGGIASDAYINAEPNVVFQRKHSSDMAKAFYVYPGKCYQFGGKNGILILKGTQAGDTIKLTAAAKGSNDANFADADGTYPKNAVAVSEDLTLPAKQAGAEGADEQGYIWKVLEFESLGGDVEIKEFAGGYRIKSIQICNQTSVWEETFSTRRGSTYIVKAKNSIGGDAWPYASQWFTGYEAVDPADNVEGNQYDNDYTNVSSYGVSIRGKKLNGGDKNTVGLNFGANKAEDQMYVKFEGGLPTISNGGVLKLDVCATEVDNGGTLNEMIITINNGIVLNIPATTLGARSVTSTIEVNLPPVQIDSLKIAFNNAPSQRFISRMWIEDRYLVCYDGICFYLDTANQTAEVTANPIHYTGDITIPTHITHENVIYSVVGIGDCAFINSNNLTSITMESETPISVGNRAFEGVNCPFYVPCGSMEAYKAAWSEYASRLTYSPSQTCIFNISTTSANPEWGTTAGDTAALYLDEVEISAIPNYGYHFVRWNDGNTSNPRTVTVTTNETYTATFAKDIFSITKNAEHGSISGVSQAEYLDNITLTVNPNYGYHFTQWSDGNTNNPRTFVLTQDTTFTAEFEKNSYTISTTSANQEWGTTAGDKSALYLENVVISATANYGYHFVKWNDNNTENPRTISVTQDTTYTATFAKNTYSITKIANSTQGSISGVSNAKYLDNVTLTVNPNYGYHFTQWSDGNTNNPRTFVLTQDTTFTAEFAKNSYTISTTSANQEWGTTAGDKSALYLENVVISATANYGYHFVKWNDNNTENPRTISVTQDTTYTATFAKNTYSITKIANSTQGSISGVSNAKYLDNVTLTVNPNYGYHFTQWSDGNTDNPRTIVLTQDTTFTAEIVIDRIGTCGDDNALTWTYDAETKTLTITGNGTLNSNYYFGIEAPAQMQKLVIGNEVTSIGDSAFYGMSTINHLIIGGSVATIGNYAFAECRNFDDITCLANVVPVINETTFANVGNKQYIYLFVPAERERAYHRDTYWGEFDIQVQQAEGTIVTTNDVQVEPQDNAATVTWPTNDNAATYTLQITKDGVVFCTLIFNANGQLTGIAFAPSRDGQAHAPQAVMTASGLQFTVTGLDSGTHYALTLQAKDNQENVLASYSSEFTTTSEGIATGIEETSSSLQGGDRGRLILHNGQIFILRGEKVYTLQGQEVK